MLNPLTEYRSCELEGSIIATYFTSKVLFQFEKKNIYKYMTFNTKLSAENNLLETLH